MTIRQTHTYAKLEVSAAAYDEIAGKLRAAGYHQAFHYGTIDMHGIGLVKAAPAERSRGEKPILCIDFDGVIHSYSSGWQGVDNIPDPVVPGFFNWARAAAEHFELVVYSSRSKEEAGRHAMARWMIDQFYETSYAIMGTSRIATDPSKPELVVELTYSAFCDPVRIQFAHEKPAAYLTIDDRAVCFDGRWPNPQTLLDFRPWYQRPGAPASPIHSQEVFYNKLRSTGAIVCSCGFATTFTSLAGDESERLGWEHFARQHTAKNTHA